MLTPPPLLLTAAGELRSLTAADWPLYQALSEDPDVVRWTTHPIGLDEATARGKVERGRVSTVVRRYSIVLNGQIVGLAGIAVSDDPEIFYALLPAARGRGAATAAARALTDWALEAGASRVVLLTIPGNAASEAVARRAGFTHAGTETRPHREVPTEMTVWQLSR